MHIINLLFHFLTPKTHITTPCANFRRKIPPNMKIPPMLQLDNQDLKKKQKNHLKRHNLLLRLHLLLMFVFSKIVLAYHQNNEKI